MKKYVKRLFALLLCIVMLVALVACNKTPANNTNNTTPTPNNNTNTNTDDTPDDAPPVDDTPDDSGPKRDNLVVAITTDSGTLDPLYNVGWDFLNVLRMMYEPMWEYQQGQVMRMVLAESVDASDPLHWVIKLKEGITFSNGNPFTASDVIFSLWRANNRVGVSAFIPELDLEKSKATDDYTVELYYTEASIGHLATFASIYMFDEETFNDDTVSTTVIGTGPYEIANYVVNSHINLKTRDGYWGNTPAIPNLEFRVLAEEAQRVNALQMGEVDIATVPFQDITYVQGMDNLEVYLFAADTASTLYMNTTTTREGFSTMDETARHAIAYAIDRDAIVNIVYDGFAKVSRFPLSGGTQDAEERFMDLGVYGHGYDPELAKQLAESSGLVNKKLLMINNGTPTNSLICEMIQANLKAIGVEVEVQSFDAGSWLTLVFDETQWDMAVDFTFGGTCAAGYRSWTRMHAGGAYLKSPWPGNEEFLPIIETIMQLTDPAVLSDLYMQLTEIHVNAMIWFELVDTMVPSAYTKGLKGWAPMLSGNIIYTDLSW